MKKLSIFVLVAAFLLNSCNKKDDVAPVASPVTEAKPTAMFKISNLLSEGWVLEGNISDFENQSLNANTYHWDFGNGVISDEKIPANIAFFPCGNVYIVKLTVKNKAGDASSYLQTYHVRCRGRQAHNNGRVISTVHLDASHVHDLRNY